VPRNDAEYMSGGSLALRNVQIVLFILLRPLVWLLHFLLGRPRESALAILVASAIGAIMFNGLFLQHGPHPAPMFAGLQPAPTAKNELTARDRTERPLAPMAPPVQRQPAPEDQTGAVAVLPRQRPPEAPPRVQQATTRAASRDSIADVLAPAQQLTAIQRVLSAYGYGPVTPNGVFNADTRAAIERFEREHRMPPTGQVSDRLVRELVAMTGKLL
jgi:hypothetical protein